MDVRSIPLTELLPPLYPVRRVADDEKMAELVRSIKVNGLLHPLVVIPEDGRYRILAGHRRYVAVSGMGWEEVPCNVIEARRQADRMVSIEENLIREVVNPVDLGWYFRHLCESEHMTQVEIGQLLGKSQPWVSHYIRLTMMSEGSQEAVQEGRLPPQGALLLETIDDPRVREVYTHEAISREKSYHQIRAEVEQYHGSKQMIDQAVETAQTVREEIRLSQKTPACFGCGRSIEEVPTVLHWLCAYCIRAIEEAKATEG